ncbi:MAG TPA: hypothetical protein PLX20_01950 [Rhodocyclaceae bacterium]|uniref:hypothetical protein n=1 Tax=Accumulibacter sp. TaxID=2053492 RepID=UPI002C4B8025|nr:hypothetical protein [Accumulibacter sp.]HMZ82669.1 hypothetical protein [Rhodocyclaceae bacterium]HNA02892.1 hypothetical protein [Rhodocyclaceae bacterium]HNB77350.1 hypothetical protein [Rhodocyclaceae bacterium]HNC19940.1 hypothetical protein [Accumulibacter sp.]HNF91174.1 hypothetical protein [Accumulibacter sp.]
MPYENVCKRLEGCWEKSWDDLPEEQRQAWGEVIGSLGGYVNDVGESWKEKPPALRQSVAADHDYQHDPKLKAERVVGWWDATMNARHWFAVQDIAPREAAMLLCRFNPLEPKDQNPDRILVDGDEKSPSRYRLLLDAFEREARATQRHRTLLVWRDLAEEKGVTCHPWIEEYMAEREALGEPLLTDGNTVIASCDGQKELSSAAELAAETASSTSRAERNALGEPLPTDGNTVVASCDEQTELTSAAEQSTISENEPAAPHRPTSHVEGCTKAEMLAAEWPSQVNLRNALSDVPKWLEQARISKGKRGVDSSRWNPALVAVCLRDKHKIPVAELNKAMRSFGEFQTEWKEYCDYQSDS